MNKLAQLSHRLAKITIVILLSFMALSCYQETKEPIKAVNEVTQSVQPDYFNLRPELEKMYGFTQAVRVGNTLKIGGVISIDDKGNPLAKGDYLQQMKNCYASIEKVLQHYGCTFNDVILENIYTTSMAELQKNAAYRHEIYQNHFPTAVGLASKNLDYPK